MKLLPQDRLSTDGVQARWQYVCWSYTYSIVPYFCVTMLWLRESKALVRSMDASSKVFCCLKLKWRAYITMTLMHRFCETTPLRRLSRDLPFIHAHFGISQFWPKTSTENRFTVRLDHYLAIPFEPGLGVPYVFKREEKTLIKRCYKRWRNVITLFAWGLRCVQRKVNHEEWLLNEWVNQFSSRTAAKSPYW